MKFLTSKWIMLPLSILSVLLAAACARETESGAAATEMKEEQNFEKKGWFKMREEMVEQLRKYKIKDPRILKAMGKVRRHLYIPQEYRTNANAYGDYPWPIGYGQTISQPYIVAYMTEKMNLKTGEKVLEIGTGSGYQAAVLAEMGVEVYSIEIIPELAEHARKILKAEQYDKVRVLTGDGHKGWPEHAPFDAVLVACAPEKVPAALVKQLKENGRMIIPVGEQFAQRLVILRKQAGAVIQEDDLPVRFVPMVNQAGKRKH